MLSGWNTGDRQFRDPAHHSVEFSLNVSRSTHRHAHRTNFLGADLARPGVNVLHEVMVCGLQRFTCEFGQQWTVFELAESLKREVASDAVQQNWVR